MGWVAQHGIGSPTIIGSSTASYEEEDEYDDSDESDADEGSRIGGGVSNPVLARSFYLRAITAAGSAHR